MVHFIWHVMTTERPYSLPMTKVGIHVCHVRMCTMPYPISWIICTCVYSYIRLGTKFYRQIVGISLGTNCAPLVADLFLYCYERDFMDSLNHDYQADDIEAFNSTSRYLDDLLNNGNPYFEGMVNQIYPPELPLNKSNISYTEAPLFRFTSFCYKSLCFFYNL